MARSQYRRHKKKPQSSRRMNSSEAKPETPAEDVASSWDGENRPRRVFVCIGPSCSDQKSRGILTEVKKQIERLDLANSVQVYPATCLSQCTRAPVVQVYPEGTIYCDILPRDVRTIVSEHLVKGKVVDHIAFDPFRAIHWNDEIDS